MTTCPNCGRPINDADVTCPNCHFDLQILMSFSRSFGWICFFALLVWLYIVCSRQEKIDRYTVDERLTQKINQLGSNMFNDVAESKEKVKSKSRLAQKGMKYKENVQVKKHFTYVQLLVVLLDLVHLF